MVPTCISRPQRISSATGQRGSVQLAVPATASLSDTAELAAAKRALRAHAAARRRAAASALPPGVAGRLVCERFCAALRLPPGSPVSGYWPQPDELDCRPLLLALHRAGHPVGLPVVAARGEPLSFRRWTPDMVLATGAYGIAMPPAEAAAVVPALVLAPLLAFDRAGYRLGYGGGFYDRTLERLAAAGHVLAVGLAFAAQEIASVPRGPHDRRLDWVVTERAALAIDSG
jgi:5-formyltetrahydrofolate cyclo-ligase